MNKKNWDYLHFLLYRQSQLLNFSCVFLFLLIIKSNDMQFCITQKSYCFLYYSTKQRIFAFENYYNCSVDNDNNTKETI